MGQRGRGPASEQSRALAAEKMSVFCVTVLGSEDQKPGSGILERDGPRMMSIGVRFCLSGEEHSCLWAVVHGLKEYIQRGCLLCIPKCVVTFGRTLMRFN